MAEGNAPPIDAAPVTRSSAVRAWWTPGRVVLLVAGLLVLAQIALRIWIVSQRWLFGDDLSMTTQSGATNILSADYLFEGRGGHLVPGGLVLSGTLMRLAPLEWWPLAAAIIVMSTLAALAVLRLVRVLLGDRPALLVPLALYLFATADLGGLTWWSAAMQTLPLQAGIAWVVADAVLYLRTRKTRYVVTAPLVLVLVLLFSERAVTIPVLALAVVAFLLHVDGHLDPVRETLRRTRGIWVGLGLVLAAWAAVFLTVVPQEAYNSVTVSQLVATVRYFLWNLIPGLAGGPWEWTGTAGSTPIATTPHGLFVVSVVVFALLVAWTSWRRRGAPVLWIIALGYASVNALMLGLGRAASGFPEFLPLAYRYYPAEPVLLVIVVGLLLTLPRRTPSLTTGPVRQAFRTAASAVTEHLRGNPAARWTGRLVVPVLTLVVVAGGLVSTVRHVAAWADDPAEDYFATAEAELAAAGDSPLLDQTVPETIMWSLGRPYNTTALYFRPFSDRPPFGVVTDQLRMFDESGTLHPARVTNTRTVEPGPLDGCGWAVAPDSTTRIDLSGPLLPWTWTAQLNYLAGADGELTVRLGPDGTQLRVPVERGPGTVFLRFDGADSGDQLVVTSDPGGPGVCIDSGIIGLTEIQ